MSQHYSQPERETDPLSERAIVLRARHARAYLYRTLRAQSPESRAIVRDMYLFEVRLPRAHADAREGSES